MTTAATVANWQGQPAGAPAPVDWARIRADFPLIGRPIKGKPIVYLDSAATSQKPRSVIETLRTYYEEYNANVHRGAYNIAAKATHEYEAAREKVRRFINAASVKEVVFTKGTTEGLNLVAYAWGRKFVKADDEVVLSELEHHSNLVPWQILCQATGAKLKYIPIHEDGSLDVSRLDEIITRRTRLVSVTAQSNVLGTVTPVRQIVARAREVGAVSVIDGAQSVPHQPVDVQAIGCDFLAFSGHKMCGPTASGVLYGRRERLEEMDPFLYGGEMIREVRYDGATWNDIPHKFEAGTPGIAQAIGLGAGIDYLSAIGMDRVQEHEGTLTKRALAHAAEMKGLTLYGPRDVSVRGGVITFNFADIHPHDLATILDEQDRVCVRAGHHCAMPLTMKLGVAATARASFYVYNTEDEIDILFDSLRRAKEFMSRGAR